MSKKRAFTISIDDDLMMTTDLVRERARAQAPAAHLADRSALITHLLTAWIRENYESTPVLELASAPLVQAPALVRGAEDDREQDREQDRDRLLTQAIFNTIEKDPDRSWTPDLLRAFVRVSLPLVTLRDIKDCLVVMEFEGLIEEELDHRFKRLKRFRSMTRDGVPSKAAVDAGLISFDFAEHEATQAVKRAEAEKAQAAITQSRIGTKAEIRGRLNEAESTARRLEEAAKAALDGFRDEEKRINAEFAKANPKPDFSGPETQNLSFDELSKILPEWFARRKAYVDAAIGSRRAESEHLRGEAASARRHSDALAASLAAVE